MRLLLDTHVLLWWNADSPQLPPAFRVAIADPKNEVFVSAATVWEIAIKRRRGRLHFPGSVFEAIKILGFRPLPIDVAHSEVVEQLPLIHRDPFDRMLVAQAQAEGLLLLTVDKQMIRYGAARLPTS